MQHKRKMYLISATLALAIAAAGGAAGAGGSTGKDGRKAAEQRIGAQADAQKKACARLQANAREICQAEAKGHQKVALAELAAKLEPNPETEQALKEARADADFDVAKERCDDTRGKAARKACVARAKDVHEAAVRQAKVEKVQALAELKRKAAAEKHAGADRKEESPQERYKARKALCLTKGTERDSCLAELDRRFRKS